MTWQKVVIITLFLHISVMLVESRIEDTRRPTFDECMEHICLPQCFSINGATSEICQERCRDGCLQARRGHLIQDEKPGDDHAAKGPR